MTNSRLKTYTPAENEIEQEYGTIAKANYGYNRTFLDYESNVSIRSDYNRSDYDYFRPSEAIPTDSKGIIALCMKAYENVGIVHNVINLMGDFTCQGIRIVHANKSIERFLNRWWNEIIDGPERANAFCNMLYRAGQVPVYRTEGKITTGVHKQLKSTKGGVLDEGEIPELVVNKKNIPIKYTFFDPIAIDVVGNEVASFIGKPIYRIKLIKSLQDKLTNVSSYAPAYREKVSPAFLNSISTGGYLDIDQDRFAMYHYKKDDWRVWAMPIIHPILPDLMHLQKCRLADSSALDSAISSVRLWTLGDLEHDIRPTKAGLMLLKNALANHATGRVLDLVWGPGLSFTESNSNSYQFLTADKYDAVNNAIYAGLGIPPTLTGNSDSGSAFSNSYISIKTLIERLNYGRSILVKFLNTELKRIQKSMGHSKPGIVVFDNDVMADESVYRNFLIELIDREYLSMESLHDKIKIPHEIEKTRISKEKKQRENGRLPDKAGPYHNTQIDDELRKIILQSGGIAPSELGIELLPKKPGEKTLNEMSAESEPNIPASPSKKNKPVDKGGRPPGKKDTVTRKQRRPSLRTGAFVDINIWANESQKTISNIITPAVLAHYNKQNCRQLNNVESEQLENIKFKILCSHNAYDAILPENVYNILQASSNIDSKYINIYKDFCSAFVKKNQRKPTMEEKRQIQSSSYSYVQAVKYIEEEKIT